MSDTQPHFKDKKVLIFGLGLLGGGVATTNWFLKQGARVTVTDLKTKEQLAASLKKIKGKVSFKLGGHTEQDIMAADVVVVNPDVPIRSSYIQYAMRAGKQVENEATLFYNLFSKPIIGITGTRGKTTTTTWTNHFMEGSCRSSIAGNSTEFPFLKVLDQAKQLDIAVVETPSYHLELFESAVRPADIAVITNVYRDHINRHGSEEEYARVKSLLFKNQREGQCVILNADNAWTKKFLKELPRSYIWLFSKKGLPSKTNGVFYKKKEVWYQFGGHKQRVLTLGNFLETHGEHNLENLLASALAAYLAGASGKHIQERIITLPQVPFRQQVIFEESRLKIINDTTATSPEGGIAAIKRFAGPACILIAGGTDRDLEFKDWAKEVKKSIKPENLILLTGSATEKMLHELGKKFALSQLFETLEECLRAARLRVNFLRSQKARKPVQSVIVFSPASKSFEKFKNEFDRGEQFNRLVGKGRG